MNKKILTILFFVALVLLLSSCKKDEESNNPLIGTWQLISSTLYEVNTCNAKSWIEFTETTFTAKIYSKAENGECKSIIEVVNYSVSGNTITIKGVNSGDDSRIDFAISDDKLTIFLTDTGGNETYKKI